MLAHRLRRWTNIATALGKCNVFAGAVSDSPLQIWITAHALFLRHRTKSGEVIDFFCLWLVEWLRNSLGIFHMKIHILHTLATAFFLYKSDKI